MKRRHRWGSPDRRFLSERCRVRVRFQEVDSLRVVWHGNYLTYFEDGRNAFGRRYDFGYEKILEAGFLAPLVHVELDYFHPAHFDQQLEIETRLHLDLGARVHFTYLIRDVETSDRPGRKLVSGRSVQVFTDRDGTLVLTQPRFFTSILEQWAHAVEEE